MRYQHFSTIKPQAILKMPTGAKSVVLYRILAIALLCLLTCADDVCAAKASVDVIQNGILKGNLTMQFQAKEVFTEKVIKFLNRGFTVSVEYKIELWRRRRLWFDSLDSHHGISYQIDFEPLGKRYICLKSQQESTITSKLDRQLDKIIEWITRPEPPLTIVPVERLSPESEYYYSIEIVIATLTTENIKHLQKWLSQLGGKEEELSTITRTSFRVAADFISSRNHRKISERSEKFRLQHLPKLYK